MKIINNYNQFITEGLSNNKYKIKVKYEHGDADFNTEETYKFKTEEDMLKILDFLYKIRNFKSKRAYNNLGYYYPLTGNDGNPSPKTLFDEDTWDKYSYYISSDKKYDRGYASIESVKLKINDEKYIILDVLAAETNIIDLPNLNDIVEIDVNHINGYGDTVFGDDKEYLPNSGIKDYNKQTFKAKVIDCKIIFNKYMYNGIYSFDYIILCETDEKVLINNNNNITLCTIEMHGWDKNFDKKYNKNEFDNLNIYQYIKK